MMFFLKFDMIENILLIICSNFGRLNSSPGYLSVDMDGNFVCAADLDKIVVWNSKSGKLIKVIPIVPHYNPRDDRQEVDDPYCWKGNIHVLNNLQYEINCMKFRLP